MKIVNQEQALLLLAVQKPLEDIISDLNQDKFRDCDVLWLNEKLENYVKMCLDILNIKLHIKDKITGKMNTTNKDKFLRYFSTLNKFFNNIEVKN